MYYKNGISSKTFGAQYRFLYVFTNGKSLFIQFQEEIKMDTGLDDFDIFPFKDETGKPSPDQPGMF